MNYLKTHLGLGKNPEALAAYDLFLKTEFYGIKPETTDRFSAIYNAFNLKKNDAARYDNAEFKTFLSKLDMKYLEESENSFIIYAQSDIDNWYKKPIRSIIDRITTLENQRAEHYKDKKGYVTLNAMSNSAAWVTSDLIKDKRGFEFLPLNVPEDEENEGFRTALRFVPGNIATETINGGLSFGYTARYYTLNRDIINGFDAKASYNLNDDTSGFVRVDMDAFKAYSDYINYGAGVSFFGDMEGSFYKKDTAYGLNAYVDIMDIFRVTYVHRGGENHDDDYLYFGIENIPSLIYWFNR